MYEETTGSLIKPKYMAQTVAVGTFMEKKPPKNANNLDIVIIKSNLMAFTYVWPTTPNPLEQCHSRHQ